jgi:hypothetical protein
LRLVIELDRTEDGIEGVVIFEGSNPPQHFSGWLELLRLLETAITSAGQEPSI